MTWLWIVPAILIGTLLLMIGIGALLPSRHRAACTITLRAKQIGRAHV